MREVANIHACSTCKSANMAATVVWQRTEIHSYEGPAIYLLNTQLDPFRSEHKKPVFRRNHDTGREFKSKPIDYGIDSGQDVARFDNTGRPIKTATCLSQLNLITDRTTTPYHLLSTRVSNAFTLNGCFVH